MDLKDKKVLVTGGAGFIGSHMVKVLIDQGAKVAIVDNLSTGKKENVDPRAVFYQINIADPKLKEVFVAEKPEIIYHFAFNVLVPKSVENPLLEMDSIAGSINILKNAKDYNIKKLIFSSSGFVYGNNSSLPLKETEPIDPISPYVISKSTVENFLKFFNKAHGLPYVIFRYATTYGPGQFNGAMADYIRKLSCGAQAEIWGDGEKTRDYIYVDDIIRANLMVLDLPNNYPDPTFNIGTGIETTLNRLYFKIAELLQKEANPIYLPDRPGELIRYSLDFSKAKQAFGWEPKFNLEEGLKSKFQKEKLI